MRYTTKFAVISKKWNFYSSIPEVTESILGYFQNSKNVDPDGFISPTLGVCITVIESRNVRFPSFTIFIILCFLSPSIYHPDCVLFDHNLITQLFTHHPICLSLTPSPGPPLPSTSCSHHFTETSTHKATSDFHLQNALLDHVFYF